MSKELKLYVSGMTCKSCQDGMQRKLRKNIGVLGARVNYSEGTAKVIYDEAISLIEIIETIASLGYKASSRKIGTQGRIELVVIIIELYIFLQASWLLNIFAPSGLAAPNMNYVALA